MKGLIPLAVAAALLAGCGSDDDAVDTVKRTDTGTETETPAPEDTAVFRSKEIDFTFEYPADMSAQTERDGQVLGQVSVEPGESLNAIKVRRTANTPLRPSHYLDEFQQDFAKSVGKVAKSELRIGALEVGILEFEDSIEEDGETVEFTSASFFFTGAARTWQVECIADEEHREEIEDACRAALESVEFPIEKKEPTGPRPKQVD